MSFVGDLLFGSEGTPGQVVDTTPDEFANLRGLIADRLRGFLSGSGVSGIPTPSGPRVAPITPQEQNLVNLIGQRALGSTPLQSSASNLLQQTLSGQFLNPASNPFLGATIEAAQRPLIRAFERTTIPNLRAQFTAAGHMIQPQSSSPFDTAVAMAQGDLMNALGDVSTRIASENFQAERGRQQSAVNQALQVSQTEMANMLAGLQASALPRLIEQRGIDAGIEEFNNQLNTLFQALALATGAASGQPVVVGGTAPQTEPIGSLLEGVAQLVKVNPFGVFGS